MELLNYKTLREAKYSGYVLQDAPVRVLQFGEGNFLRAFVDYFFDVMNEKGAFYGKVMLVQPISQGRAAEINAQEGLYTLYLRGSENGRRIDERRVISSVASCIDPYSDYDALSSPIQRKRESPLILPAGLTTNLQIPFRAN